MDYGLWTFLNALVQEFREEIISVRDDGADDFGVVLAQMFDGIVHDLAAHRALTYDDDEAIHCGADQGRVTEITQIGALDQDDVILGSEGVQKLAKLGGVDKKPGIGEAAAGFDEGDLVTHGDGHILRLE